MASPPLPLPINYEDNRQPRAFPSVFLTGGNGVSTGIALQNVSGNLDVPGISINGTAFAAAAPTPGVSQASAPLVLGANKNTDVLALPVSGLAIGPGAGTPVNTTAAELNVNNGATPGTVVAGKTVVAGAQSQLAGLGLAVPAALTTAGALTAAQSGSFIVLNSATSFVTTLPAANALGAGSSISFVFACQVATTSGVGHIVRPAGTDVMRSTVITTPAAAKGVVNTQATSKIGDLLTVWSDGVGAWYADPGGTWTREA